ncbi:MAG: M20 family metallopeptidase [Eubacteriales bacterium]
MDIKEYAKEIRKKLHEYPEIGNEEFQTTKLIESELAKSGIESFKLLDTGLMAVIKGEKPAKHHRVIAFRADIDGLRIQERTNLAYASKNSGFMHACGHDAHTAILLATAKALSEEKKSFSDTVVLIFQPAEESTGGAERMIELGCLDNPKVEKIFGLHVMPNIECGKIGVRYGEMFAASDMITIKVNGASGHGAFPERGVDAVVAASNLITSIQTIVSRNISPVNPCVITFGSINGGTANNIIADYVEIKGTIRTIDNETRKFVKSRIAEMATGIGTALGARIDVEFVRGYDPLINEKDSVDDIVKAAEKVISSENIIEIKDYFMGGEDFSFYLNRTKGAFFGLGSGYKGKSNPGLHTNEFEIDDNCLGVGIEIFMDLVE